MALPGLHHRLGVAGVGAVRPDRDPAHRVRGVVVARVAREKLQLAHVIVGRHRAAAAPALVAEAEIRHPVRRGVPVGRALLRRARRLLRGHVLEPVGRFLRGARADVDREIGLGADLLEEVHELVRAEGVRLDDAAPVGIERGGRRLAGPMPLRQ